MARPIWSGSITFGLVNVPVKLYSATSSHKVPFHQFERDTGRRVRHRRVAEGTDEEVAYEDLVKGVEVAPGQYVVVDPEELEAIQPTRRRAVEIEDFVDLEEIDPIAWNRTYYLGPDGETAEKPYELLRRALEETGRVAIARFVMRTKEYLATIRPLEGVLALETMYFADEIRGRDEVQNLPEEVSVSRRELDMAERLIESLSAPFELDRYRDEYHDRVLDLIERKAKGEHIVVEPQEEPPQVVDLMEALQASLEGARGRGKGRGGAGRDGRGSRDGHASAGGEGNGSGTKRDLDALSKGELYERASAKEIPGRSKMNKRELIEALRRAS